MKKKIFKLTKNKKRAQKTLQNFKKFYENFLKNESKIENLKKHLSLGLVVMIYLQHRVKLLNQFIKSMNI